jgi:hypothetical protein
VVRETANDKESTLARISAAAVKAGASKDASYDHGVAVFTMPRGGLMAKASEGGQKFEFTPK